MFQVFEDVESEVRIYCRDFPAVFGRAKGSHMFSSDGRRYLDFLSAAGSLNYGHNEPDLINALLDYIRQNGVVSSLDLYTIAKREFLETIRKLILEPRDLPYKVQFTGPTGANAIEAAFKLTRKLTGRRTIYAFHNAYHGLSLGALAATYSKAKRISAGIPLEYVKFLQYGESASFDQSLEELRCALTRDRGAAVVLETIQGEAGALPAQYAWLRGVREICTDFNVPLIIDDIQAGCGRTGKFFSFEASGIKPDIIALSKSLSGIGLPLAVLLIRPDYDVWTPGEHTGTFRGNNFAFVTAKESLLKFWSSSNLSRQIDENSELLDASLRELTTKYTSIVRTTGRGLLRGIHFRDAETARAISAGAFQRGLICETAGADGLAIKLLPPLTISKDDLLMGIDTLDSAISDLRR